MLKYIIALIFLIAAGFGLKMLRSDKGHFNSPMTATGYTPSIEGKNQKLVELEKAIVTAPPNGFTINRNSVDLSVTTPSGKVFQYTDSKNDSGYNFSYVIESRQNPNLIIVYTEAAENRKFSYLLANGNEIPASHYLYFSPSGNSAIQISSSEQKYGFAGWSIFEKDGDTYTETIKSPMEFQAFNNVGLNFENWENDYTISATVKYSTTQKAEFVTLCAPAEINVVDDKWILSAELDKSEQDCSDFKHSSAPEALQDIL